MPDGLSLSPKRANKTLQRFSRVLIELQHQQVFMQSIERCIFTARPRALAAK